MCECSDWWGVFCCCWRVYVGIRVGVCGYKNVIEVVEGL